jgi:hypothetical protein
MCDAVGIARDLVFALRMIEADADGALEHGNAEAALRAIRERAGSAAADAARRLKMPPYDKS